jgi:hypothetical protein
MDDDARPDLARLLDDAAMVGEEQHLRATLSVIVLFRR